MSEPVAPSPLPRVTFSRIQRDVLVARGPDTVTFLQGQLSQDVAALAVGQSAWSFLLQPQGKVDAWLRVHRRGPEEIALDVEAGWGPAVQARLERFKLRTRCELELTPAVATVAVRGVALPDGRPCGWPAPAGSDEPVGPDEFAGSDHLDETGRPAGLPADAIELDHEGYEALRIGHGVPAMGAELTDATIPAEVGQWAVDASVSFTKGCFTGQELVARIDSRGGNVPRHLRRFVTGVERPLPGTAVLVDGEEVGMVTSISAPREDGVGLAYVHRRIEPPVAATAGAVAIDILAG